MNDPHSEEKSSHLIAETDKFQALFESLEEAILVVDPEGRILEANPAACQLCRAPLDRLLGSNWMNWIPPERKSDVQQAWEEFLATGHLQSEIEICRTDHSCRRIHVKAIAHLTAASHLLILHDVLFQQEKDRQQRNQELEKQLQRTHAQLEALRRELESFVYSVSHDLRTPLRHIDGFIQILKKRVGPFLNSENQRLFDMVSGAAQEMNKLIQGLLMLSRVSRMELRPSRVNLNELASKAIQQSSLKAEKRKIEWITGNLPEVEGDPLLLLQVLNHLISNAIKFTRPKQVAQIEIGSFANGAETVIFVRDNGVGFDMKYAHRLFGTFQRLHPAEAFEGTGISLAIARRIIERHGGRIWAEGTVDQGATFFFSMPIRAEP